MTQAQETPEPVFLLFALMLMQEYDDLTSREGRAWTKRRCACAVLEPRLMVHCPQSRIIVYSPCFTPTNGFFGVTGLSFGMLSVRASPHTVHTSPPVYPAAVLVVVLAFSTRSYNL